jgi:hypothetical protein
MSGRPPEADKFNANSLLVSEDESCALADRDGSCCAVQALWGGIVGVIMGESTIGMARGSFGSFGAGESGKGVLGLTDLGWISVFTAGLRSAGVCGLVVRDLRHASSMTDCAFSSSFLLFRLSFFCFVCVFGFSSTAGSGDYVTW